MIIYFIVFVLSLVGVILAAEITLLTKKGLDASYKFMLAASLVFALVASAHFLVEIDPTVNAEWIKYLELLFVALFVSGLAVMRRVIRNLEEKKTGKK